jgi:hypothetical protein
MDVMCFLSSFQLKKYFTQTLKMNVLLTVRQNKKTCVFLCVLVAGNTRKSATPGSNQGVFFLSFLMKW